MNLPNKIPIERMEDYHTHYIGKYEGGNQFWGYDTFVTSGERKSVEESWQQFRREYVVLYLFDKDGNFIEVKSEFAGTTDSLKFDTETKLEEMVSKLSEIEYCNIEVKLFEIEIDGFKFGLIPDEESKMIELQPSSTIAFSEPWDGEYYT